MKDQIKKILKEEAKRSPMEVIHKLIPEKTVIKNMIFQDDFLIKEAIIIFERVEIYQSFILIYFNINNSTIIFNNEPILRGTLSIINIILYNLYYKKFLTVFTGSNIRLNLLDKENSQSFQFDWSYS